MITLLYFAGFKEKAGKDREQLKFEGRTVKELLDFVQNKYEGFDGVIQVAVNEEYAVLEDVLHENDFVALIPPVSGG